MHNQFDRDKARRPALHSSLHENVSVVDGKENSCIPRWAPQWLLWVGNAIGEAEANVPTKMIATTAANIVVVMSVR